MVAIKNRLYALLHTMVLQERSPRILTWSLCAAVYIAFSPFVCLHTVMIIIGAWCFGLNFALLFTASNLINNPWTMVPVYSADYFIGKLIMHDVCGINMMACNPSWMATLNKFLFSWTGIDGISLWTFIIGGNILGIALAALAYVLAKPIIYKLVQARTRHQP